MTTIIMLPAGSSPMHTHSLFLCLPTSTMWAFQKESMVERHRDIKDICHVVSLCINIKKAEGRRWRREKRRREGETIDSIGGDRSQEDRAVARPAGRKEVFEIGHLTAFSSRMMLPSLSTAAAPSSPCSSSSTLFFISFSLALLTYVPICSSIIYTGKVVGRAWRHVNLCEGRGQSIPSGMGIC